MLVVIGDTHDTDTHRLDGEVLAAVREAGRVVHTGDFTREPVLEAIQAEADHLLAVSGNNDDAAIQARLPETRIVEAADRRFVVVHGHQRNDTSRDLLVREAAADVLIVGHSHRPGVRELGNAIELNPGSYADPRWYEPSYAVIEQTDAGPVATIRRTDGAQLERVGL